MIKKHIFVILIFILSIFSVFGKTERKLVTSLLKPELRDTFYYSFYEGIRLKDYPDSLEKALEKFRFCISLDSADAGVFAEAGMLYDRMQSPDKAIVCLENSCRLTENDWWYGITLISMYDNNKFTDKAIALGEKLRKKYPQKEEIYQALISLYKESKQFDKTISVYNALEKITGVDESVSFDKLALFLQLNQGKKAIAEMDKLIRKYPSESRYKVVKGDILMQIGKTASALQLYQSIIAEDSSNPYVYLSLSEYYSAKNEPEKAMNSVLSALKNDQLAIEEKLDILNQYVHKLLTDSTRLVETESLFRLLNERYPFEPKVHEFYAQYLNFRNRPLEAYQEFETIVTLDTKNQNAWIQMMLYLMRVNNFEEMTRQAARGLVELPDFSALYFYNAIAWYQLSDTEKSLLNYKKAAQFVKPDQLIFKSDIYGQLGDLYFKLGNKSEAYAAYEESIKANPKNTGVLNNYAYFLSVEKSDLSKAESLSAQTIASEPNNSTFLDTYAWIFYQRENYSLAKFYIEKAISNLKSGENSTEIFEHYGDILLKNGNREKALEMWKKAAEQGNSNETLKQKIQELTNRINSNKL